MCCLGLNRVCHCIFYTQAGRDSNNHVLLSTMKQRESVSYMGLYAKFSLEVQINKCC
jgi:hypothetical protein